LRRNEVSTGPDKPGTRQGNIECDTESGIGDRASARLYAVAAAKAVILANAIGRRQGIRENGSTLDRP
jgi:hypothetical protein